MRQHTKRLADMRKFEDPRLSFSTPEFRESQRIFTENFKVSWFGLQQRVTANLLLGWTADFRLTMMSSISTGTIYWFSTTCRIVCFHNAAPKPRVSWETWNHVYRSAARRCSNDLYETQSLWNCYFLNLGITIFAFRVQWPAVGCFRAHFEAESWRTSIYAFELAVWLVFRVRFTSAYLIFWDIAGL